MFIRVATLIFLFLRRIHLLKTESIVSISLRRHDKKILREVTASRNI